MLVTSDPWSLILFNCNKKVEEDTFWTHYNKWIAGSHRNLQTCLFGLSCVEKLYDHRETQGAYWQVIMPFNWHLKKHYGVLFMQTINKVWI